MSGRQIGRPPGGAYKPLRNSIASQVAYWFSINRDEYLSRTDVAQKFDLVPSSVDGNLRKLVDEQWLKRTRAEDSSIVYAAGDKLPTGVELMPLVAHEPALNAANALHSTPNRRGHVPEFDLSSVQIDKNVPMPAKRGDFGKGATAILLKMEVGDSVRLPHRQACALRDAYTHAKAQHPNLRFTLRRVDETHSRVWRSA